jgi:hypothetical protein
MILQAGKGSTKSRLFQILFRTAGRPIPAQTDNKHVALTVVRTPKFAAVPVK